MALLHAIAVPPSRGCRGGTGWRRRDHARAWCARRRAPGWSAPCWCARWHRCTPWCAARANSSATCCSTASKGCMFPAAMTPPVEAGKSSNARTLQRRASLGVCTDRRPAVVWGWPFGDVLHNSLRSVIARPRAVRCVAFLANSTAIGCQKPPCGPSRSALPPTREGYAGHP